MNIAMTGYFGERTAAEYLRKKGYHIITTNYRSRFGEIDLIATKDNILAFVEVKTRRSASFASALEQVDIHKQRRLMATAQCYLAAFHPVEQPRFDVIEVYIKEEQNNLKALRINHLENAFTG